MEKVSTREAYGRALAKLGESNKDVVALDADVSTCTMSCYFGQAFPGRFYNVGIAEANMVGMAAGMATFGLVPFVHSFAAFSAGRTYDQVRNSVAYPGLNVKVVGTHAGLSVGEDGATHQCVEDIGLMRAIPGMTVICPADGHEAAQAVEAIARHKGPVYLRLGRAQQAIVTRREGYAFEIGKSVCLRQGKDVAIIATGLMVEAALEAAEQLEGQGISARVVDMHTIKPLDIEAVKQAAAIGAIVTAEEHNILTGLGGAVAEVVGELAPCPVMRVGVRDVFGHSGNAESLMKKYGLTAEDITRAALRAMAAKAGRNT